MTKRKRASGGTTGSTKKASSAPVSRRQRPKRKLNPILLIIGGVLFLLLLLLAVFIFFISRSSSTPSSSPTVTATPTPVVETPVAHGATGKSITQDRQDALATATTLLNLAGKNPTGASPKDRLQALENGDYKVIDPALPPRVRVSSSTTDALKIATYQSLVTFNLLYTNGDAKAVIKPQVENASREVYVDPQLGIAFVPLKVYSKDDSGNFSLELVYVNKQWQLNPYSLVDSVKLSAYMVEKQKAEASASPQATK